MSAFLKNLTPIFFRTVVSSRPLFQSTFLPLCEGAHFSAITNLTRFNNLDVQNIRRYGSKADDKKAKKGKGTGQVYRCKIKSRGKDGKCEVDCQEVKDESPKARDKKTIKEFCEELAAKMKKKEEAEGEKCDAKDNKKNPEKKTEKKPEKKEKGEGDKDKCKEDKPPKKDKACKEEKPVKCDEKTEEKRKLPKGEQCKRGDSAKKAESCKEEEVEDQCEVKDDRCKIEIQPGVEPFKGRPCMKFKFICPGTEDCSEAKKPEKKEDKKEEVCEQEKKDDCEEKKDPCEEKTEDLCEEKCEEEVDEECAREAGKKKGKGDIKPFVPCETEDIKSALRGADKKKSGKTCRPCSSKKDLKGDGERNNLMKKSNTKVLVSTYEPDPNKTLEQMKLMPPPGWKPPVPPTAPKKDDPKKNASGCKQDSPKLDKSLPQPKTPDKDLVGGSVGFFKSLCKALCGKKSKPAPPPKPKTKQEIENEKYKAECAKALVTMVKKAQKDCKEGGGFQHKPPKTEADVCAAKKPKAKQCEYPKKKKSDKDSAKKCEETEPAKKKSATSQKKSVADFCKKTPIKKKSAPECDPEKPKVDQKPKDDKCEKPPGRSKSKQQQPPMEVNISICYGDGKEDQSKEKKTKPGSAIKRPRGDQCPKIKKEKKEEDCKPQKEEKDECAPPKPKKKVSSTKSKKQICPPVKSKTKSKPKPKPKPKPEREEEDCLPEPKAKSKPKSKPQWESEECLPEPKPKSKPKAKPQQWESEECVPELKAKSKPKPQREPEECPPEPKPKSKPKAEEEDCLPEPKPKSKPKTKPQRQEEECPPEPKSKSKTKPKKEEEECLPEPKSKPKTKPKAEREAEDCIPESKPEAVKEAEECCEEETAPVKVNLVSKPDDHESCSYKRGMKKGLPPAFGTKGKGEGDPCEQFMPKEESDECKKEPEKEVFKPKETDCVEEEEECGEPPRDKCVTPRRYTGDKSGKPKNDKCERKEPVDKEDC